MFRVPWEDDKGDMHVNTGYRVQYSSAIGPYKGGLRFAPNVNISIIKFLGFEQVFKDALSTLPIGGAKGGADFDPNGKSDKEVQRFCRSFMQGLFRFIGPDVDCPAGDLGVGGREIGYMFGAWRRLTASYANGALSGKDMLFGGSAFRPEATGYGAVYYLEEVLKHENDPIEGKKVAVAGFGNVSWGVCKKLAELGVDLWYPESTANNAEPPKARMNVVVRNQFGDVEIVLIMPDGSAMKLPRSRILS